MQELLKQKENLEQQLVSLNRRIDEAQNSKKLIQEIKNKTKELEYILLDYVLVKVHYLEKSNKLLITDYSDEDYSDFQEYDPTYETTLYKKEFDNLHETLDVLNTAIKNHKIITNKFKIRSLKPLLYDYEYSLGNIIDDDTLIIQYSDYVITSFPESFKLSLNAKIKVSDNDTVDLKVHTIISYNHDINKEYSKNIDGIEFQINYNDYSDYTNRFEEFVCEIKDVKLDEIYNTLLKVRTLAFSNSHLVKLSTFKN